jgi:hypothetical protein
MGLLAPAFLFGVLAIGLPIWLHRLQAQSSVRQAFSSAMLLEPAEQQVHVRKKLKYLLLLALRITLLALLTFAFAKPYMTRSPDALVAAAAGSRIIVVDTSASMSREGVFSQAQSAARRAIDDADDDVVIQLVAADNALNLVTDVSTDKAAQRAGLSGLSASALRLDYGEMMAGVERIAATLPQPVSLHLVSDFQSSAMPARFSDLVSPQFATFEALAVGTGNPVNWSIDYLRETAEGLDVGVSVFGDRERVADIELLVNDVVVETRGLNSVAQQTMQFTLPELIEGDNKVSVRIETDDDLQIDNQWFHVVENNPPAEVPLITYNPGGLPVTYLSAALESAAGNLYRIETLMSGQFDTRILSRYQWLVIDDIGSVDDELGAALIAFMRDGGNLLAFAGNRAASLASIPVSGHVHAAGNTGIVANQFLSVGQTDTGHPVLAGIEGWHNVNVLRNMPVQERDGDQVLIRLENGDPYLLEQRTGEGRLLLMLGGLDSEWSDLPVRPVFVSFIIEAAKYLSEINDIPKTYSAGANLPLVLTGNASGQVVDPDGGTVLSLADTTREQQIKLNKAGFYEVYTPQGETVIAANIDPLESDLDPVAKEVLDRWQDAMNGQPVAAGASLYDLQQDTGSDTENRLDLWHWLLLVAALILISESLLSNTYLTPRRLEQG